MTNIAVVGTASFWNDHPDPTGKLISIWYYIDQGWTNLIENGSGDFAATIDYYNDNYVEIPESALESNGLLEDRLWDSDDWLKANWHLYNSFDSIQVVDYWGGQPYVYGHASIGSAGAQNYRKCGITDTQPEDVGQHDPEYSSEGSEGTAIHELFHNYNARHPDHAEVRSNGDTSLMWSWSEAHCEDNGNPDMRRKIVSSCTQGTVRDWVYVH